MLQTPHVGAAQTFVYCFQRTKKVAYRGSWNYTVTLERPLGDASGRHLRSVDSSEKFSVLHNRSEQFLRPAFPDRVFRDDFKPLHKHPVLLLCDGKSLRIGSRPAEGSGLQPFVQKKETVTLPQKTFDPVAPPAAEQEEDTFIIRIQIELVFYNGCQTFHATPQIRIADGKIDLPESNGVIEHQKAPRRPWQAAAQA